MSLSITEVESRPAPPKRRWRLIVFVVVVAVLVALFVPPSLNLYRFAGGTARAALERALGRRVSTHDVRVLVLPPGLVFKDVSIEDDPAFGAEPIIHADEMTATLRLSSLWHGRLEVASLSLSNPSLNLARSRDGRWNIQALLLRAAETPTAPTTQRSAETRPRFPYISADSGRINFKLGEEKMVYAVQDADFSLWLESEDEWRMRLKGRLVRADMNLSDIGTVTVEGSFTRARAEHDNVVSLTARLENAQLGQLSQFVTGHDHGWRGTVDLDASAAGSTQLLTLAATVSAADFHRYDLIGTDALALRARCTANYAAASLANIECHAPAGKGDLSARGSIAAIFDHPQLALSIVADRVPAQSVVSFLQHTKAGLPADLAADGAVNGAFTWRTPPDGGRAVWSGGGTTTPLKVASRVIGAPIEIARVQFGVGPSTPVDPAARAKRPTEASAPVALNILPFSFAADEPLPLSVSGDLDGHGYRLFVRGDSGLPRLVSLAQLAGMRAFRFPGNGAASVDLQIAGQWSGFPDPEITGTAALRNVVANVPGVNGAVNVAAAKVTLDGDAVNVSDLSAGVAGSPLALDGALSFPRHCQLASQCPVRFDLHTDQLVPDEWVRLLDPELRPKAWYSPLVGSSEGLPDFHADGTLSAGKLQLKNASAGNVTMDVHIARSVLRVEHVHADLFGGRHIGELTLDCSTATPRLSASGSIANFTIAELAAVTRGNWGTGSATLDYSFSAAGRTAKDLLASATGSADFDWRQGTVRGIALPHSRVPLKLRRFTGKLALKDARLEFTQGKLLLPDGIYEVKGTASFGRQMDLRLVRDAAHAYSVGGTLDRPVVRPLEPAAQAELRR